MVVVRGVNLYPSALEDVLLSFTGIAEYRVEVQTSRALPELRVLVELSEAARNDATLPFRVEIALRDAFTLRIPVSVVPPESLPRFEMKARRWIRI